MSVFSRFAAFTRRHPVVRGMISYAVIWPTSSIVQQTLSGKTWRDYDWERALRFSLYGGLFVAPTLYGWVRISSLLWPQVTLKTAITKVSLMEITKEPSCVINLWFELRQMSMVQNSCYLFSTSALEVCRNSNSTTMTRFVLSC